MRVAIAGLMHESNTFSSARTDRAAFESGSLKFGSAVLDEWRDAHHEMGGFIEGAGRFGYELEPVTMAWATPSGPVADAVLDEIVQHVMTVVGPKIRQHRAADAAQGQIDGLLLALHGAMVCHGYPDGDGEVLRRLREAFGPAFPIVVTLDFHANLSELMVRNSTAIVFYQTNPHVDQRQRGLHAASILVRIMRGEVKPAQAFAKPPNLITIACQNTSDGPMRELMKEARELEHQDGILSANISAGFPYADVFEVGPAALVVTDNDPRRARAEADRLADGLFKARKQLVAELPDAETAVRLAMGSSRAPIVLVEFGDNIGGGSPGDSTILFAELLRQGADRSVVVLYDPQSVADCVRAGVGSVLELAIGGKTDRFHGDPVRVRGRVESIHDGHWIEDQPRHGGRRQNDQGQTVVLRIPAIGSHHGVSTEQQRRIATGGGDCLVVLNSKRTPPFSLGQLTSVGIEPAKQRMIVVKAAIAYRAAYGPIAGEIIEVDTPGLTANNLSRFEFRRARRPLFPIDQI